MIFERIDAQAILWSMYFNIPSCLKCTVQLEMPANFHVACGPYFELDYEKSIQEVITIDKKMYSNSMYKKHNTFSGKENFPKIVW